MLAVIRVSVNIKIKTILNDFIGLIMQNVSKEIDKYFDNDSIIYKASSSLSIFPYYCNIVIITCAEKLCFYAFISKIKFQYSLVHSLSAVSYVRAGKLKQLATLIGFRENKYK